MRLDQLQRWAGDRLTVTWRSFLLRPTPEQRSIDKFTEYTRSWARPESMEPGITFRQWSGEHQPPSHSLPSSVAGKLAESYGDEVFHTFHFALLEAYFSDNRTVSDLDVLVDIARASGIDGDEFGRRFVDEQSQLAEAVIDDHNEAVEHGITGVPGVMINDGFPVTGAQDLDFYQRVVSQLSA